MNGVFTEKLDLDYDTMWGVLYQHVENGICVLQERHGV